MEAFLYVLDGQGQLTAQCGGQSEQLTAGGYVYAPPGEGLQFANTGQEPVRFLLYKPKDKDDALLSLLREPAPTHDPDPEVRRETYREALKSGSLHELIAMVRDIYTERTLRRAKGKQLSAYEDSALRNAQNALHSEFAYVMGIRPDEVPAFIEKELNKA